MAAMAMVQAQNTKKWVESFQSKSETFNFFFFSKRFIFAENDFRRLNLGSKCSEKSTLVQHKTPWQYWCTCTVGSTCSALYMEKLKVSIVFGKANQGWKFPRAHFILYFLGLGGLKRLNLVSRNREFNSLSNETEFSLFCVLYFSVVPRPSGTLCLA